MGNSKLLYCFILNLGFFVKSEIKFHFLKLCSSVENGSKFFF